MVTMILMGLIIGILTSASGLGGGFLVVPVLLFLGKEAKLAIGTSFVFVLLVSISSLISHAKLGNIDYKTGLFLAAGGIFGAQIGPLLLRYFSDLMIKRFIALILITTAVYLFVNSRS